MRIARYLDPSGGVQHGCLHPDGTVERLHGDPFGTLEPAGEPARIQRWLAPVQPVAIFGIGLNYRRHALETGAALPEYPVLFMKSPAALQHPNGPIELPETLRSHQVDAEAELAVVIGRRCRNVGREEALGAVLGYTCANDVSARDWQKDHGGGQWCRGKTCDTFAPLGPVLATTATIADPGDLEIKGWHNGDLVQHARTSDMIFDVPALIAFLSASTTLLPGTVILTGTPEGVGMAAHPPRWLAAGDTVAVEIEGIGRLSNPVVPENTAP